MSVAASTGRAEPDAPAASARSLSDRLLAALPLLSVYAWLCVVYLVEAWSRVTPWLFGDELELTQLSRSIAATGHAARRGQAHSPETLYTAFTAPLWLIHNVGSAYAAIKYVDVFAMASVVFPTYLLARLVVGRGYAVFAAAAAGAIPSLAYSSYIVEETIAYPYAALCLFLIAKSLLTRRPSWIAAAAAASIVAPVVRGELVVVPLVYVLAAGLSIFSSPWFRRRRASWSLGDYAGLLTLVAGAIFLLSGLASHHSQQWYVATDAYENRMFRMGMWAAAALVVAVGVLPMIAGLASLWRPRAEEPTAEARVFRSVFVSAIVGYGMYTAVKAAYLSTTFATRVEGRNLIYVAPLLFVGTAIVLAHRRAHPVALAAAAGFTLYLVAYVGWHTVESPYEMGVQLYSDALGFGILQAANRYVYLSTHDARILLVGVFILSVALLFAPVLRPIRRRGRLMGVAAAVLAIAVVAWNLTGEIGAAVATVSISRDNGHTLTKPFSWVDDYTRRTPTLYFGAGESDPTAEQLLEFWNRSIVRVSSLDGTVQGPGPSAGPNVAPGGIVSWDNTPGQYDYAVEDRPCVEFAGTVRATHPYRAGDQLQHWWLVQLTHPNRLVSLCMGLSPDGWSGIHDSQYFRFSGGRGGRLTIVVSLKNRSGPSDPSPLHVIVGRLVIGASAYPEQGAVTQQLNSSIDTGQTRVLHVRAPADSFMVRVIVDKKWVPHDLNPHNFDTRVLGAQISYRFEPTGR
ncbi:MAG TPA: hypothetical protein VNH40_03515 [Gaiellaceae bacterium]|nr:hypothetical protein [Gaiellaceae bacterium]